MSRLIHQNYKNEYTEMKYLSNTRKNIILKLNNSLSELEKDFKPINVSIESYK